MGAEVASFDLYYVGLARICAGHGNSPERGFDPEVGKAHALQRVNACAQQRQANLALVEGGSGRAAGRLLSASMQTGCRACTSLTLSAENSRHFRAVCLKMGRGNAQAMFGRNVAGLDRMFQQQRHLLRSLRLRR